ncbi:MAG TPA: hypothetical protein VGH14_04370 [Solirubrobacterales bacterium]|jgi:hypothetical protein
MNTITNETEGKKAPEELELKIQATNGDIWDTEKFDDKQKVEHVIKRSVKHFVDKGVMSEGEYDLCRLHKGTAQPPLDPSARLRDAGVENHDHLVLVPAEPQTDG